METEIAPSPLDTNGLCLLSLDGGGVRGLSSLLILKDVMTQLNLEREASEVLRPCDVFDLIGGTSTGGLIAIMLGRLEMDVDACILAYTELMKSVFSEKINNVPVDWSGNIVSQYDSKKLKKAIENVITHAGLSPTDLMNDGKSRRCKTFVCTTSKDTLQVTRLRSYSVSNESALSATICEAALATSAATRFFDSVSIGNHQFVDGAFGANNPIEEVEEEAADIWCTTSRALKPIVKCLVSVGTGNPAQLPMDDNVLKFLSKTLVRLATKPESTERRFMARWSNEVKGKRYFRFNVEQGLQQVHMTEFEKQSVIESATYAYLHHSSQKVRVRDCVVNLSAKEGKTSFDFETMLREHGARLARLRILETINSSDGPLRHGETAGWFVPFERNPRYVDREVVGKVKRRLFSNNRAERIAVFGLGGIGKTQIALELAYQTRELYPDCAIFWLPAVDTESLQQAYQSVADQLGIHHDDTKADPKCLVKDHLSNQSNGRWLLIFDNADDIAMWTENKGPTPGGLKDYLPTSDQGAIVFTTRSNKVARYLATTDVINIPEMDEHRATNVLRNSLVSKEILHDTESTRKLLSRLTFLPLAIVQAASFINENGTTLAGYAELLDGQEQSAIDLLSEDFEDKGRYKSIRNPVATTWLTSFEQIRQQNQLATDYLCFMACIHERDILISLLTPAPDVEQQKAIGLLSSYSFVRVRHEESRLDMHRLVRLATRNWLRSIGALKHWQLYVLRGLDLRFPSMEVKYRTQWRAAMPHALQVLALTAEEQPTENRVGLLFKVATCQTTDGRYKKAEELFSEMIKVSETLFGPEDQWTIAGLSGLAATYSDQGKPQKAIEVCKRILEMQERLRGSGSIEVTRGLFLLTSVYREAGKFEKAVELNREVIQRYLRSLGPNSWETLNAVHILTLDYFMHGRLSDALELSVQSLRIHKMALGLENIRTVEVMVSMGIIYLQRWQLNKAESLLAEAIEIQKRILGNEHPANIRNMTWLARTWKYQGRYKEAVSLRTECLRLSVQCFGLDHEYTQRHYADLDVWTSSDTLHTFLSKHFRRYRHSDMIQGRRLRRAKEFPKLMVGGFLFVPRKPKNDLLLREIQEAMKDMSMEGQVSSGEVTLVDDQNQNQEKVVGRKVLM
ncbi:Acyl transferase/acyl hydrolase/lysophospholipase [Penicillium chrysogenum]|uniref:Acyl transferase/acyl hydrolase/lysophospholipase n=1 Tax=Penicillium chrysogenum TaxID=5076 RepID=UPI0024DF0FA4|nr:Acyl transferase/acyl hydrolase/lysophospholipase [Penicillium chrysogenum]KAJ5238211.1 Acyl transferase/acyl hydrolase/lysophospholipase [Penicillium chrysogenum]